MAMLQLGFENVGDSGSFSKIKQGDRDKYVHWVLLVII